ncbi:MAG: hypothetical protein HC933_02295 [Pleurocapsa sp. SU_196_0]|nr:hypothetical protein [Pleurocapsa sp. SU_196_0]
MNAVYERTAGVNPNPSSFGRISPDQLETLMQVYTPFASVFLQRIPTPEARISTAD